MTAKTSERDKLIDGFRGVAVLCVVAAHSLSYHFQFPLRVAALASPLSEMGVQLFFVISGYIITTLLLREEAREGRVSIPAFYARRALRILPPLLCFYLGLFVLRYAGAIDFNPATIAASAAFTCNTGLTQCDWWVAHTWSLAVEEQYYLAWPLLLTFLPAVWRVPFLSLTIATLLTCFLIFPEQYHSNWISFSCIAAGAAYAASPRLRDVIQRLASYWLWLAAGALFGAGHLFGIGKPVTALTPALILFVLFAARELPLVVRALSSPTLQVIGLSSYSLYLWQQAFLGKPDLYLRPVHIAALLVLVALSYFLLEKPGQRVGHRLSKAIKAMSRSPATQAG